MRHDMSTRTATTVDDRRPRSAGIRTGATARAVARVRGAVRGLVLEHRERGDVPGWVLVTLMTAGLVVALWAIASPMLTQMFEDAVSSVSGP